MSSIFFYASLIFIVYKRLQPDCQEAASARGRKAKGKSKKEKVRTKPSKIIFACFFLL